MGCCTKNTLRVFKNTFNIIYRFKKKMCTSFITAIRIHEYQPTRVDRGGLNWQKIISKFHTILQTICSFSDVQNTVQLWHFIFTDLHQKDHFLTYLHKKNCRFSKGFDEEKCGIPQKYFKFFLLFFVTNQKMGRFSTVSN